MVKTFKIKSKVGRYKVFKDYQNKIKEINSEYVKYYKFYEISSLRELANYKKTNPISFKLACFLHKINLN